MVGKGRENQKIPPQVEKVEQVPQDTQGDQVHIVGGGNDVPVDPSEMTSGEFREALLTLDRALTNHVNMGIGPRVKVLESTMTSRLRDFVRMNPLIFHFSKVGEDP